MKTIVNLTSRLIKPTGTTSREEKSELLRSRLPYGNKKARHATFEIDVFNFLLDNKNALGIRSVTRFTNTLVDGALVLTNGKRLVIEVKLRMNWLKACQSGWQFTQFVKTTTQAKTNRVDGAIVVFEEFSGDWDRKSRKAKNKWGWEGWYLGHFDIVEGKPIHLLSLCDDRLEGYPA